MLEGLKLTDPRSHLISSLSNDRSSLLRACSRREWDRVCNHRRSTAIRSVSFSLFAANRGCLAAATRMSHVKHALPRCCLISTRLSHFENQVEGIMHYSENVATYALARCLESPYRTHETIDGPLRIEGSREAP